MRLRITAHPRIHICLVDLAGISARSYCGVGFSLTGPVTRWLVEDSDRIQLIGTSSLDARALHDIDETICRLVARGAEGFTAELEKVPQQHIGLGTKTTLLLSLIAAVDRLKDLGLSSTEIRKLSGRGGASGIGVNLFFCGGFAWDGGHPPIQPRAFLPSGAVQQPNQPPPMLARWSFPDRWVVSLVLAGTTTFAGSNEIDFFKSKTPISADDALQTMSFVYHGVVPAVSMNDLSLLKVSLEGVHSVGLKYQELGVQSKSTIQTFVALQALPGAAVGLSSLGPLIYCISEKHDDGARESIVEICQRTNSEYLGTFLGSNDGFSIESS
ncbi:beta-ribofuranosylaminobenzene 5'-phosphate synthase family protein [Bradyrhizobium sp. SZCCHNRI3043]|uniref:beta-ribofuranosylaminobenzene 5'-phosphate synthase family protein n=1 Tax=Bradyrhizobium sp. SZCCHNRI3043 TaxID=3057292 RepID=UPI0039655C88